MIGLTRLGIKPASIAAEADPLSARPSELSHHNIESLAYCIFYRVKSKEVVNRSIDVSLGHVCSSLFLRLTISPRHCVLMMQWLRNYDEAVLSQRTIISTMMQFFGNL